MNNPKRNRHKVNLCKNTVEHCAKINFLAEMNLSFLKNQRKRRGLNA